MEEDAETRKISSSFLRDHSYATEGEPGPQPPARPQQVRPPRSGPGPRPHRRVSLRAPGLRLSRDRLRCPGRAAQPHGGGPRGVGAGSAKPLR